MDFDLVITNGTVVDGTGQPSFKANVGIKDGKIAAVATDEQLNGETETDAAGLVVAPGFIDIHSHFDWNLPLSDHDESLRPLLMQGVTTLVTGMCGHSAAPVNERSRAILHKRLGAYGIEGDSNGSAQDYFRWNSVAQYLDTLENQGVQFNMALIAGHGTLRYNAMGKRANGGDPTPEDMKALGDGLRQALEDGAFGLSAGLGYEPGMYAEADELLRLLEITAAEDGLYAVHSRSYSCISPIYPSDLETPTNILSTREQLDLARQADVRLQLSHLLFHGRNTWETYETIIDDVERSAEEGLDVAFDSFPYTFGNTTINVNFPKWFLKDLEGNANDPKALERLEREMAERNERLGRDYRDIVLMYAGDPELADLEGLNFSEIADRMGVSAFEAYMHVVRRGQGSARILQDTYSGDSESEEPLRAIMAHPRCAFMTDTLVFQEGYPNRATYGTYPRILGHYVREVELFPLEEAVRRATSFSAERLGLDDEIGQVAEGYWADIVLFNPETVADNTTPEEPDASPSGIEAVLIGGKPVVQKGERVTEERRGRVLRRS